MHENDKRLSHGLPGFMPWQAGTALSRTWADGYCPRIKMFIREWAFKRQEGDCMKAFKIDGKIEVEKRCWQKFSKEIAADDEAKAREKLFCDLGSRQGMKRRNISIKSIQEVKADKVVDAVVRYQLGVE